MIISDVVSSLLHKQMHAKWFTGVIGSWLRPMSWMCSWPIGAERSPRWKFRWNWRINYKKIRKYQRELNGINWSDHDHCWNSISTLLNQQHPPIASFSSINFDLYLDLFLIFDSSQSSSRLPTTNTLRSLHSNALHKFVEKRDFDFKTQFEILSDWFSRKFDGCFVLIKKLNFLFLKFSLHAGQPEATWSRLKKFKF